MEARGGSVETLDPDDISGAANIAQDGGIRGFVPQRYGALLDHVDERCVRRRLPADVLFGFVKFHPAAGGQGDQIGLRHELERRMLLEEVGDSVRDGGRLHAERFLLSALNGYAACEAWNRTKF